MGSIPVGGATLWKRRSLTAFFAIFPLYKSNSYFLLFGLLINWINCRCCMKTLIIFLLCILDILLCTTLTVIIPHKISKKVLSIIITVLGCLLSIALLFLIALLGIRFEMIEQTRGFILITFAINAFINTIYLFLVRRRWI